MSGHVSLSICEGGEREGESGNGEVNGMATNHLQGRLGSPQEDGRLSGEDHFRIQILYLRTEIPFGNTQKLKY